MTDYTKLIEALRCCPTELNCAVCLYNIKDGNSCNYVKMLSDAADAIEKLQAELKELCDKKREFKRACGLVVDEPMSKHGEWIDDELISKSRCSVCDEEWSWFDNCMETFNYCPNCGAKMFASDIDVLNKNDTSGVQE